MAKNKKSLYSQLTTISRAKSSDPGKRTQQMRRGIEAKVSPTPFMEDMGWHYQRMLRTAVNLLQQTDPEEGDLKNRIGRDLQEKFDIDWVFGDSIATQAKATLDQLTTAKGNLLEALQKDIDSGREKVAADIEKLQKVLAEPTAKGIRGFDKKLLGIRSKLKRLERQDRKLQRLSEQTRLHICWGSKKLFNAQHHLDANGYESHEQWREDWEKARSGNFYLVGKGSAEGGNTAAPIRYLGDDRFSVTFKVPRFLKEDYGDWAEPVEFELTGQRKADLLYAMEAGKPITVQCFRREHKDDQWYIHLTAYVQVVPTRTHIRNGCIGIDLNAETIDIIYIKRDGNPHRGSDGRYAMLSFPIPTGSTGQVEAALRDICAEIVLLAEVYECPIACENLDFSVKKNSLRHSGSKRYNRMLSGFIYDKFRSCLVVRAEKYGVQVLFKNPAWTSVIGMIKYMPKYGLNSATAAAMVIARRAMGFSERVPLKYLEALSKPEDCGKASNKVWKELWSFVKDHYSTKRHSLFQSTKVLEAIILGLESKRKRKRKRKASPASPKGASLRVGSGAKSKPGESPSPLRKASKEVNVQLCLSFQ